MEIQTKFESLGQLDEHVTSFKARITRYMKEFKASANNNSECIDSQDYGEFQSFAESLMEETKEKMELFLSEKYRKKTERISYEVYEANEKFRVLMNDVFYVEKYLKENFPRLEKLVETIIISVGKENNGLRKICRAVLHPLQQEKIVLIMEEPHKRAKFPLQARR